MDFSELLSYDPITGDLTWKKRACTLFKTKRACSAWNARYSGRKAGHRHHQDGKRRIVAVNLMGSMMSAHRIIWIMVHGHIPDGMMPDHIDGNPFNNRLANLRIASKAENNRNRAASSRNTCGIKGVRYKCGKWYARITVDGTVHYLGAHQTKGLASVAYAKASLRYHGQFARPC